MKIEEAIDNIKESIRQSQVIVNNPTAFYNSDQQEAGIRNMKQNIKSKEMAINALEKQIPKMVIEQRIDEYFTGKCPGCRSTLADINGVSFCSRCGQALEWSY